MSTKFVRKNRPKKQQDDNVAIDTEVFERDDRPEYLCDYCHYTLSSLNEEGEYWCSRCSLSFIPNEDTRTTSMLETPEGPNREVCVSYMPEPDDLIGKPLDIKGTFKMLKDKGLHITSYIEHTSSRVTKSRNEESNSSSTINKKGKGAPRPIGNTWE